MELVKQETPLEYQHDGVTFLVKKNATAGDKLAVAMSQKPIDFVESVIQTMVTGWRGVTKEGKAVAYSYEMFKHLPDDKPGESIMLSVAQFIMDKTDIIKSALGDAGKKA